MILLDGKKIALEIREELKNLILPLRNEGKKVPGLVTILVGSDPASEIYVRNKGKACREIGMNSESVTLNAHISEQELLHVVNSYNNNPEIHGILVQLPLPNHINEEKVIDSISPRKDVDGFHPYNVGKLVMGKDTFVSCTPAGIQEVLIRYGIETSGKHIVVVGRSNIVGKPISILLMQKNKNANAIVTICHSAAKDISQFTKSADILIAAIGKPEYIKGDMVKDGVVVIDVGINRVDDSSNPKGSKILGDVEFESVSKKASHITPVPGGIGPMTIAMLLKNTYKAFIKYGE